MAIRNNLKGGTNLGDEAGKPSDWNDTFNAFFIKAYGDSTRNVTTTTTETDLTSITVSSADWDSGSTNVTFLVTASISLEDTVGLSTSTFTLGAFQLYVNGSSVKTVNLKISGPSDQTTLNGCITYLATANDLSSSDIIVKISSTQTKNGHTQTQNTACEGLTILAMRNN